MSSRNLNRRSFFRAFVLAPAVALSGIGRLVWAAVDVTTKLVNPSDPTAGPNGLGYHADAKTAPKALRKDASQICGNCLQYQDKQKETFKGEEVAPCIIFGGKYVHNKGWCKVWAGPKKV